MRIATRIELAFGADLTADSTTWVWTDVSTYALGSVSLTFGRADEASTTQPATCRFRLRNTDARFSPRFPTSPYYPNVRRQTPVRVSLNPGGTGYVQRFQGYIDQFVPTWPSGRASYAEVSVTASGILRRLGQGSSPVRSALYRAISQAGPVAYWPLEDGEDSTQAASGILGGTPMVVTAGKVTFADASGLPSSADLANFSTGGVGGSMLGTVPAGTSTTSWRVEFVTKFNAFSAGAFAAAVQWLTGGSIALWEIDAAELSSGGLSLQYIDAAGGFGGPFSSNVRVDDGLWHHIRVDASQSGGNIALTVKLDGTTVITQTLATLTMGSVTTILVNPTADPSEEVPAIGHVAVWAPFSSSVDTVTAWRGNAGETAGARIVRLCAENDVAAAVSSTTGTTLMGPQSVAPLLALLRECEAADGGILYDGAAAGISYLARQDRYNLSVALALDATRSQVKLPFQPIEDDQRVGNDWTVSRTGGSKVQYKDAVHIAANGLYDSSATVNVQSDSDLLDQAAWRVHLGTVEEMRVPGLSLQLIDHSELWTSWLSTTLGERVTVTSLFAQYPPGTLDAIVEGYTEDWDQAIWRVEPNLSPFAPWRIIVLATTSGDTGTFVGHVDTDDSALSAGITSTAASVAVRTNSGPLWTTASDDFPFDLNVGGEQITVTAVSSAVNDVFSRTVSGGWSSEPTSGVAYVTSPSGDHSVGSGLGQQSHTSVNVFRSAALDVGTGQKSVTVDVSLPVANAASAVITQWICGRYLDNANYYVARLDLTTTGTVMLNLFKRVAGTLTSLGGPGTIATGHAANDWWRVRIDTFGSSIKAKAWLPPAVEPDWMVSVTDTDIPAGGFLALLSRLESGNTNTLPVVVSWNNLAVTNPQTFTVTRSVNTVVKAHLAGAAVSLWAPLVLGL